MSIITVSGETGSLRNKLANEICERGGMELVDRRTLMDAVEGLVDLSRDEHQLLAEQGPAMLDMGSKKRRVFASLLELVVLQYAEKGKVALVGRGANFLLRLVPGVLRVRTVSPLELRAQRIANAEGLELDRARQLATVVDQQRRAYVAHVFGLDWGSALNYDLVLNMGRLSLEQAATTVLDLAAHPEYLPSAETERVLSDLVVSARVRRNLVEEVDVHALEVDCIQGRVTISGYVSNKDEELSCLDLARNAEGVAGVQSQLEISPSIMKFIP